MTTAAIAVILSTASPVTDSIWDSLRQRYLGLQTLSGEFTETVCAEGEGVCRTFEGKFQIEVPSLYRLEVTEPESQLIVGNDSVLWMYFPAEGRAVRQAGGQSVPILAFLGPVLDTTTTGTMVINEYGATVLKVTGPDEDLGAFYDLELELDDDLGHVDAFRFTDAWNNHYHFRLRNQVWNASIPVAQFEFDPPPGVQVE